MQITCSPFAVGAAAGVVPWARPGHLYVGTAVLNRSQITAVTWTLLISSVGRSSNSAERPNSQGSGGHQLASSPNSTQSGLSGDG